MSAGVILDALLEELEQTELPTVLKAALVARLDEAVAKEAAAPARGNLDSKRAPKRTASAASADSAETTEKQRRIAIARGAIDGMADEWICQITQELPVDPLYGRGWTVLRAERDRAVIRDNHGCRKVACDELADGKKT